MSVKVNVNGVERTAEPAPGRSLLELLRNDLGITGPKLGCGEGACGACTVLIGSRAVQACQVDAASADGQRIITAEGLAEDGVMHPVQQAWLELGAMQCGYCTPGWLTGVASLLARNPHPADERIDAELAGHACRCCAYPRIRRAIHRAAELMDHPELLEAMPAGSLAGLPASAEAPNPQPGNPQPGNPQLGNLQPGIPHPASPWDLARTDPLSFAEAMPEGLLTVVADDDDQGWGGGPDDAWVHVGADGAITAFTGKVEAGQGTRTALAMLVGEELAVRPGTVRLTMADTDTSPFDLGTFGSRSMPIAAPPLRAAAAAMFRLLRAAAAARFGLPEQVLTAGDGMIAGPDGGPSASYGELVAGQRRVERVPSDEPVRPAGNWQSAGRPARAAGGPDVVAGAKQFPSDLRQPGMLHGRVLHSPAAGATLRRVDTAAAGAMPGVTVIHDGSFVGVVAASEHAASAALAAIEADWVEQAGPGPADLEAFFRGHLTSGQGRNVAVREEAGDPRKALAAAAVRLDATYHAAYVAHVPLEPRVALARWDGGRLTVWAATSTPFRARQELAAELGVDEAAVRVVVPDFGGGFGGKHGSAVGVEAARLARAVGLPVKVQWTRGDEFTAGYLRPAAVIDVSGGMTAAGELTAWSFANIHSGPAGLLTPYRVPNQLTEYLPADGPLARGSYRALAATANNFARESHIDDLAAAIGADPVAFRLRHLDDERLAAALRAAAAEVGWDEPQPDGTGIGIALGMEKGGRVATAAKRAGKPGPDGAVAPAGDCGGLWRHSAPGRSGQPGRGRSGDGPRPGAVRADRVRGGPHSQRLDVGLPGAAARRRPRRPERRPA